LSGLFLRVQDYGIRVRSHGSASYLRGTEPVCCGRRDGGRRMERKTDTSMAWHTTVRRAELRANRPRLWPGQYSMLAVLYGNFKTPRTVTTLTLPLLPVRPQGGHRPPLFLFRGVGTAHQIFLRRVGIAHHDPVTGTWPRRPVPVLARSRCEPRCPCRAVLPTLAGGARSAL